MGESQTVRTGRWSVVIITMVVMPSLSSLSSSSREVCLYHRQRSFCYRRGRETQTQTQRRRRQRQTERTFGCISLHSYGVRAVWGRDAQRATRRKTKARALESRTEKFLSRLEREAEDDLTAGRRERERERGDLETKLETLQSEIDGLYEKTFSAGSFKRLATITSAAEFSQLGKADPKLFAQVMEQLQESEAWKDLQERCHSMKLKQMRVTERLRELDEQERIEKKSLEKDLKLEKEKEKEKGNEEKKLNVSGLSKPVNIVLVCG